MTARRRGRTPPAYGPAGDACARSAPGRPATARADCASRLRRPSAGDVTEPVLRVLPGDDIAPAPQPIGSIDPKSPPPGPHGVVSAVGMGHHVFLKGLHATLLRACRHDLTRTQTSQAVRMPLWRPTPPSQPRSRPDSPSFCALVGVCTGGTTQNSALLFPAVGVFLVGC